MVERFENGHYEKKIELRFSNLARESILGHGSDLDWIIQNWRKFGIIENSDGTFNSKEMLCSSGMQSVELMNRNKLGLTQA